MVAPDCQICGNFGLPDLSDLFVVGVVVVATIALYVSSAHTKSESRGRVFPPPPLVS